MFSRSPVPADPSPPSGAPALPGRPVLGRLGDRLRLLHRGVRRRRRLLAVVLTAAAVAVGLRAAAPPAPETTAMLVAARDLPAGATVGADDLRTLSVPPDVVPGQMLADPVGATLAAPLGTGEPVTRSRVVGPDLTAEAPGLVPLPIRISDAGMADLLEVGSRIDLLATDPQAGSTSALATGVVVLALPSAESAPATGANGALGGRLIVVGIPAADVQHATTASVTAYVTFAWAAR